MIYGFAVNPPLPSLGPMSSWRRDPLNRRTFIYPKDPDSITGADTAASLLELPLAAPQPWIVKNPGRPEGRLERFRFKSEILKNERRLFVYTPPGYDPQGAPLGLVAVFDGWAYVSQVPTPVILDNLIAEKKIPPLVGVFIDNANPLSRGRELGDHAPMAEFLAKELWPWMQARYRISDDPSRSAIAGSSSGGSAAICAALRHPEIFGNVLAQSGAYFDDAEGPIGDEWIFRHLIEQPKLPIRFYLDVGRYEPLFSVNASRHLRNVLEAKGYAVRYAEFAGGHDYSQWRGTLADGLIALLGK
jgi:enterochelin esterase family protein